MNTQLDENTTISWLNTPAAVPDIESRDSAITRQAVLTKPPGALGRLEDIAIRLAALQGTEQPCVDRVHITVFAGDHGVAAEDVSAFPQAVTAEMIKNFTCGGAAICVMARGIDAKFEVINLGTAYDTGPVEGVKNYALGPGTANFTNEPAMNIRQLTCAIGAGRHAVEHACLNGAQLFIGGEIGIGNTTVATALACALLNMPPEFLAGPGTGLDSHGVARKVEVIRRTLNRHSQYHGMPLEALRRLGGFEIAALTGSYIACAHIGLPVLVDGFISSVAALAATRLCPGAGEWLLFSHTSAEPGHRAVLESLDAQPLFDLGMRLGEGSGAAVVVPLLRMACAVHNEMATFDEAGVSKKSA